jgi:malonate transporter
LDSSTAVRTIVPILILVGFGYLARKIGVLKSGDERVLNAYVYYFALPALFLVDLSETKFTGESLIFVLTGIAPILVVSAAYFLLHLIFRFSKDTLYLLTLTTIFGSLAFFGIPFIVFAFPEAESLATLSAASISIVSVPISITVLEFYRIDGLRPTDRLKQLGKRLSRNPLILSILIGSLMSIAGVGVPAPLSDSLHMLGITTAPVAIFLLGVFLYGRTYTNVGRAFQLSLLRIILLPTLALIFTAILNLHGLEKTVVVLMHATPIAISTIVLSERYDFHKETIASLLLISSVGAAIYLNLWLLALGQLS